MGWTINDDVPDKTDAYEWEASSVDRDGVLTDTVALGDLNVLFEDFDITLTLAPTTTGLHSGQQNWNYESSPDSSWYVIGNSIVEDDQWERNV